MDGLILRNQRQGVPSAIVHIAKVILFAQTFFSSFGDELQYFSISSDAGFHGKGKYERIMRKSQKSPKQKPCKIPLTRA